MPDCGYCDESFADESALDAHLAEAHADELGPIDRRRVERRQDDGGSGMDAGLVALLAVLGIGTALVIYVVFFAGGGGTGVSPDDVARTPTDLNDVHFHGTINVSIAGDPIDFSRSEYQNPRAYPAFHFERGDGTTWHGHARGITLEYAMATVGIGLEQDRVTFDGRSYDGSEDGTTVRITVNNESVAPTTYVLREGDHVHILVTVAA